ncbi:hypothetical protein HU200_041045 [Digitaria exilis]|uniref:Uncharacterized protein n=1 Tax=Digitaria exilis TaxID=1010633 RepID=A0A835BDF8_9POAL|nr:hypothetical protein HU200_041045 [Digitaria exilis]
MAAQELMTAHIVSMTLKAAMELGLIDTLTGAPAGRALTADELAAKLPAGATNKAEAAAVVDRMLRFLASHGVVRCSAEEVTGPDSPPLRRHHLAEALLEGRVAFEIAHGMPAFEYMGKNPQLSALYNQAMSQLSTLVCGKMLESFTGFDGIGILVDVGGGIGTNLGMITSKYKNIKGINFDLPFVVSQAKPIPGVEHIGGDMLDYVPSGDAIFMKSVLHLLSDEDCVKLLKNCYRAVPDRGKVIAMEVVLPVTPEATQAGRFPFLFDIICLINGLKGGKERTEQEYARLATDAGFNGAIRSTVTFGGFSVLEFTK